MPTLCRSYVLYYTRCGLLHTGAAVQPPRFSCDSVRAQSRRGRSPPSVAPPPLPPLKKTLASSGIVDGNDGGCLMGAKLAVKTTWQVG